VTLPRASTNSANGEPELGLEERPTRREWAAVLALAVLAVVLRLAAVAWIGPVEPHGDQRAYVEGAESWLDGETYTERRGPGYSFFLAAAQTVFGRGLGTARVGNALLGALLVVLAWRFARDLLVRRTAFLAAVLIALHPRFVSLPAYLLSENLYVPLVAGALLVLVRARRDGRLLVALAGGALLGLAALTRSMALYFVPIAALIVAWPCLTPSDARNVRGAAFRIGAVLLGAVLVVTPWTVRNAFVHRAFVPIGFADGIPLFEGNFVEREPGEMKRERRELNLLFYRDGGDSELEANRQMRDVALGIIRERQPTWIFEKLAENGPKLYTPVLVTPYPWELREDATGKASERAWVAWHLPFHLFCLVLFPVGLLARRRDAGAWPGMSLALAFTAYSAFVHVVANAGFARFQVPYEWILLIAACAVLEGCGPLTRRRRVLVGVALALVLVAQLPILGWWRRLLVTVLLGAP